MTRTTLLLATATSIALGCGEMYGTEAEALDPSLDVERSERAILIEKSYPEVMSSPWYAKVEDTFRVELPNWRIHNNGCIGRCDVELNLAVMFTKRSGEVLSALAYKGGTYHGPDAQDYAWPDPYSVFTVERTENTCFQVLMWAYQFSNYTEVTPTFCWDTLTMNWEPTGGGAQPIGTSQSLYAKDNADFDISFRFRLRWLNTAMSGALLQNQGNELDGQEWHHLPVTLWNNPVTASIQMTATQGDPDLYTSTNDRPTLFVYSCRPYYGELSEELCTHSGMTRLWASVQNYKTAIQSKYKVTITPGYQ